jgi:spore maturation protein CgeB
MRILVAGAMTHLPGHLATGSASAFRELGHDVRIHDYLQFRDQSLWKLGNRARLRFRSLQRMLYPPRRRALLREIREYLPQLLFVVGGEMYDARTIHEARRLGAYPVVWIADDPYQPNREIWAAPAYERVYVFDKWYVRALREHGVRWAEYLPMACDPSIHRPVSLSEDDRHRFGGEVCFVGTWYPKREEVLKSLRDFRLQIWGGGWPLTMARNPGHPLRSLYRGRAAGAEVVRIYCGHRAVLNIQHPQSRDAQNMRTFEGPASGSATLTEWTSELPQLFREDEEIVAYRNLEELKSKLRDLLRDGNLARRIGEAGMRRAHAEHSYRRRMERVLWEAA